MNSKLPEGIVTLNRIKKVSITYFTKHGYEGTSMADIANEVGIKKQSIYTHFKKKDDLFLEVCQDVFHEELEFVKRFIQQSFENPLKETLFNFLSQYKERYEAHEMTKFWLRTSFFPPEHLYEEVISHVYKYLDNVEEILLALFEHSIRANRIDSTIEATKMTAAFLGVLDAVLVEMLYGGEERFNKRLIASWDIYWNGILTK